MKKEKEKESKVVHKITELRHKKGFTLDNLADELEITPAAYRKIETGETNLTVERLYKIAAILKEPVSNLLELDGNVCNQTNHDNATGNHQYQQIIENFYNENKEFYEKLLAAKDELISIQKDLLDKYMKKE